MYASKRTKCQSMWGKRQRKSTEDEETEGEDKGEEEKEGWRESSGKMCETFNRRVAGSPEEYPAEREALEKPVGANLFYFEYKVGDEIFPAAVKMCVVDETYGRALARARRGNFF